MEKRMIKSFQGLRVLACFMVFLAHLYHVQIGEYEIPGSFGWAAVSIFFILSGFLAQMKYIERGGV